MWWISFHSETQSHSGFSLAPLFENLAIWIFVQNDHILKFLIWKTKNLRFEFKKVKVIWLNLIDILADKNDIKIIGNDQNFNHLNVQKLSDFKFM